VPTTAVAIVVGIVAIVVATAAKATATEQQAADRMETKDRIGTGIVRLVTHLGTPCLAIRRVDSLLEIRPATSHRETRLATNLRETHPGTSHRPAAMVNLVNGRVVVAEVEVAAAVEAAGA
jgi:hypothetical protein